MNCFGYLKITTRLTVLLLTVLVALCGIAGFGTYQVRRVCDAASYATVNGASMKDLENKTDQQGCAVEDEFRKFEPFVSDDKDMLAVDRSRMSQVDPVRDNVLARSGDGGKQDAADLLGTRISDLERQMNAALAAHCVYEVQLGQGDSNEAKGILGNTEWLEAGSAAVLVVLVLGASVSRSITRPIGEAVRFARTVAQGDLRTASHAGCSQQAERSAGRITRRSRRAFIPKTSWSVSSDYIKLLVENNPQIPDRNRKPIGDGPDPTVSLYATCEKLEARDADIIAISCNTAHAVVERIQPYLGIPIVNMLTVTGRCLRESFPSLRSVGVLATSGTIESGVCEKALNSQGSKQIVPGPPLRARDGCHLRQRRR